jgi:hypothetical protein
MKALYEEELKILRNKKDLTIICEDKKEFKCNETILKRCSQYFKDYIESYPGKSPDFSEGEIIIEFRVVRDCISILHDLKHTDLLMTMSHEELVKRIEFFHFLLVEEPILNKIIFKLNKKGYVPANNLNYEALSKTWNSTLIESKLAKFVRLKILSLIIKDNTNQWEHILEALLKNYIDNNQTFKYEYETVTYLALTLLHGKILIFE